MTCADDGDASDDIHLGSLGHVLNVQGLLIR